MPLSKVEKDIFVGDLPAAESAATYLENKIAAVLSLLSGSASDYAALEARLSTSGVAHLHVPIDDAPTSSLAPHLSAICGFLSEHRGSSGAVLVHCVAGSSRSVSAVLAHQIVCGSVCLDAELSRVRALHRSTAPAPWFLAELRVLAAAAVDGPVPVLPLTRCCGSPAAAPLLVRAAACGQPLIWTPCACPNVRCRKCRSALFPSCRPVASRARAALVLADATDWGSAPPAGVSGKVACLKCGKKIGGRRLAMWTDGIHAGVGRVWPIEITAGAVDWALESPWPPQAKWLEL